MQNAIQTTHCLCHQSLSESLAWLSSQKMHYIQYTVRGSVSNKLKTLSCLSSTLAIHNSQCVNSLSLSQTSTETFLVQMKDKLVFVNLLAFFSSIVWIYWYSQVVRQSFGYEAKKSVKMLDDTKPKLKLLLVPTVAP